MITSGKTQCRTIYFLGLDARLLIDDVVDLAGKTSKRLNLKWYCYDARFSASQALTLSENRRWSSLLWRNCTSFYKVFVQDGFGVAVFVQEPK